MSGEVIRGVYGDKGDSGDRGDRGDRGDSGDRGCIRYKEWNILDSFSHIRFTARHGVCDSLLFRCM